MDRHLLPEEIDLLVDGEVGFGTAPLKAHARTCAACRSELEAAGEVIHAVEHLPLLSPSPQFADRLMAQVHVFVPWHVAFRDGAHAVLARAPRARAAALVVASVIAVVLTVASLWAVTRLDTVVFAAELGLGRARALLANAAASVGGAVFGHAALQRVEAAGQVGIVVAVVALLVSLILTTSLLRAVARPQSR